MDTLEQRFWFQVRQGPDRVAIRESDHQLTYGELGERVARVASALHDQGVREGDHVGVCLGRGSDLLAVLLGIWSVGAAYVPMDSKNPATRLAFMAVDVRLRCVVAGPGTGRALAEVTVPVVDGATLLAAAPRIDTGGVGRPGDIAYIIYTSGSTGQPKGVAVTHRNLASFIDATAELLPAAAHQRVLFSTPLSFDIAGLEIFLPLTRGGTCVVAPQTWLMNSRSLAELISSAQPSLVQATPTGWRLLLDAGVRITAGQTLLCGGEDLPRALAAELAGLPAVAYNMYGPTEATIWSTAWRIDGDEVCIGGPMRHATVHVLDDDLNPTDEGELYIGGPAVAEGYYNRRELTARHFLPDPWSPVPGARMYATGDIVRRRGADLVWLHRRDSQVKLHGVRIELGEIEAVAVEVPGVSAAVALIHDDALHLFVAASVIAGAVPVSAEDVVRRVVGALRDRLPASMHPREVRVLDALPLSANGKVDRGSLARRVAA
ncbi:amino acid adenylation domain-containing protein [Verrucosispora sp. WMMD573]|uniref:amino acid adenylation domain-containing protein n=1 Tax=Verrucosispora sp. WMMD573 TaxID=3015149 RepID=UPI00248B62FE|nr:amino acid adenylation domain-containing protein [Verrucosispora sp. WMMD573]WBB53736.1 amino acid adenylation domain-containing protein [Verrucosispora sp. WMMD573]